jgi:hypothetical protein
MIRDFRHGRLNDRCGGIPLARGNQHFRQVGRDGRPQCRITGKLQRLAQVPCCRRIG